jgi:hypothetical protein
VIVSAAAQPQLPAPPRAPLAPAAPAPPAPPLPGVFDDLANQTSNVDKLVKDVAKLAKDLGEFGGSWFSGWNGRVPNAQAGPKQAPGRGTPQVEELVVGFSDAGRPGTIVATLFSGSLTVKGRARKDVAVRVSHNGRESAFERDGPPPPAGMRRLTPSRRGDLAVEEDNNQLVLRASGPNAHMDIEIEVPLRTNLTLRLVNGGDIDVEGVDGNLEVNNVSGAIRLTGVAGSVVANAVNDQVLVRLTRVSDQKAMAFSSLNGSVDVTLPASTKANLRVRSDNGDVFTDFDVQQTTQPNGATGFTRTNRTSSKQRFRLDGRTIYGTINGGGPEIEARSFNGTVFIRKAP